MDLFVHKYYKSLGEPLPESSQSIQQQGGDDEVNADIMQSVNGQWGPWLIHGDRLNGVDDDEYDPDRLVTDTTHMFTLACNGAVVGLPVRFMQHSTLWALYWQFLAYWEALKTSGLLDPATGAKAIAKQLRQLQIKFAATC